MTDEAIRIEALRKTYKGRKGQPEKHALKGIDLTVPCGSVFGLLGPNGAGKSTLINILAGLVLKTSGKVTIWGFDQDANPRQSRASIGVMPQELNLDPFFTPRGALEVQAGLYGVPKAERDSDGILKLIGLEDKAEAYARTLSGGMRRRLLLGKALVHRPNILVLDEPTAGVDIELRQMLWENVRKLNAQGMTIILTTHYLEEAEEICVRIAIINHGEIVHNTSMRELLKELDAETFLLDIREPLTKAPVIAGFEVSLSDPQQLALAVRKGQSINTAFAALDRAGITVVSMRNRANRLEELFVDLVERSNAESGIASNVAKEITQ